MTGNELVKSIRSHKGKVYISMIVPNDTAHIVAEKQDLCAYFRQHEDDETGMEFRIVDGVAYINVDYSIDL